MDSDSQVSVGNSRALATNPPELQQKRTTHECIANHLAHYMPPRERFRHHGSVESPPARLWLVIPLQTAIHAMQNGRTGNNISPGLELGWLDRPEKNTLPRARTNSRCTDGSVDSAHKPGRSDPV